MMMLGGQLAVNTILPIVEFQARTLLDDSMVFMYAILCTGKEV